MGCGFFTAVSATLSPIVDPQKHLIGRGRLRGQFGRALKAEFQTMAACILRIAIRHPAPVSCADGAHDGLEKRLREVMAAATPTADKPSRKAIGSVRMGTRS
jgi:hypothetical protein